MHLSDAAGQGLSCLWLARTIPLPLSTGDNVYSARLAQALAASGASVTFMGLLGSGAPSLPRPETFEPRIGWNIVPGRPNPAFLALASPLPHVAARFGTRDYAQYLERILRAHKFDAIILDHYAMVWAIGNIKRNQAHATPTIVYIAHNFETRLSADIAQNFDGNLLRKVALYSNARKITNAEHRLARAADIIVTLTSEDAGSLAPLSTNMKLVLPPGYDGPRVPQRRLAQATPRRVAVVGSLHWTPKQMNLAAFLEAADPIMLNAGIGLDIVGEVPDQLRKACEARVRATRFHGFVDNLGEFLAGRRMGLVVEETGGGFKLKALDYIFNRLPIAAIRGSMAGLPLTAGHDYLCFESLPELAYGVAAAIDDLKRLNLIQQAAYAKCENEFEWSDRGRSLGNAIRQTLGQF